MQRSKMGVGRGGWCKRVLNGLLASEKGQTVLRRVIKYLKYLKGSLVPGAQTNYQI